MILLSPNEELLMHDIDRGRRRLSDMDRLTGRRVTPNDLMGTAFVDDRCLATTTFGVAPPRLGLESSTMIGGSSSKTPESTESENESI
jgi:hypothetical protein